MFEEVIVRISAFVLKCAVMTFKFWNTFCIFSTTYPSFIGIVKISERYFLFCFHTVLFRSKWKVIRADSKMITQETEDTPVTKSWQPGRWRCQMKYSSKFSPTFRSMTSLELEERANSGDDSALTAWGRSRKGNTIIWCGWKRTRTTL